MQSKLFKYKLLFGSRIKSWMGVLFFVALFIFLPKLASAATLYISPSSGNYSVGSTITVNVLTNTQGASVNTAEARISFSANTLDFVSAKQGSTFYLASPGSAKNNSGVIYLGGGLPTPGYSGSGGTLGSITFRAKIEGVATISIDSGKILLNDGFGTDALSGQSGARFTIAPSPVGAVTVSSSTHPSPESWYAKSDLMLSWNRPNNVYGFSFELDQNPNTVPDNTLDTTITTSQNYPGLKDGIWYFHIKGRPQNQTAGFGATTHYKIQIDTAIPNAFDISVAESTITFEATDELSGVDHYEVWADNKSLEPKATSPYTVYGLKDGTHQIKVIAFDKAGNKKESVATMEVKGVTIGFFKRSIQVPLYLLLLINLLILILIALIIWFIQRRKHLGAHDEVAKLRTELKELQQEYSEAAALNKKIDATKRKIASKLGKSRKRGE